MIPMQSIPRELEDKVNRELEPGEKIRWMEQPIPRYFTPVSIGAFLFGIPWTAFAIFWICGASGFRMPDFSKGGFSFFPLFGVPFVLVGLAMLSAPLWSYRKAFKTVYVITDRRAIMFDGGWMTMVRSYPPHRLQNVYRKEKRNGSGDVILEQRMRSGGENGPQAMDVGFLGIRDPKAVEGMLRELAQQAHSVNTPEESA